VCEHALGEHSSLEFSARLARLNDAQGELARMPSSYSRVTTLARRLQVSDMLQHRDDVGASSTTFRKSFAHSRILPASASSVSPGQLFSTVSNTGRAYHAYNHVVYFSTSTYTEHLAPMRPTYHDPVKHPYTTFNNRLNARIHYARLYVLRLVMPPL
jgi:hypothetical protein